MTSLLYLANARLPSEKAHGYQILQMCQAFQEAGARVRLIYPARKGECRHSTGFTGYYALRQDVPSSRLPLPDLLALAEAARLPMSVCSLAFRAQTLMFGLVAAYRAAVSRASIIYTRDFTVAALMCRFPFRVVAEIHALSPDPVRFDWQIATLKRCHKVVAMTGAMAEAMVQGGLPRAKVLVAHDAVDLATFRQAPTRAEARIQLGLSLQRRVAAFVGKYHTNGMEKGIPDIILAATRVLPAQSSLDFWFVGGPLQREAGYRSQIADLGLPQERFHFLEKRPVQEVPVWLAAADVLLMPHPRNAFYERDVSPLKLFEYMSARRPIVASNLPSVAEILVNGRNGLLGEPGDASALADNILRVLANPDLADELGRNAFGDVQTHTWLNRARSVLGFCEGK